MTMDAKIKPYDVYPAAIRAELDAAAVYRDLQGRVKNEVLKQKLDFLAKEEDRHKGILERLFRDHFPERKLVVPAESKRPKSKASLDAGAAVLELFKLAMTKEKEAEEYYRDAKARVDDAQSKKVLEYLRRVERSHYYMLQSEVALLEKFPDYYDADAEYLGQDLFHVGG
jgi:rubrerythrin